MPEYPKAGSGREGVDNVAASHSRELQWSPAGPSTPVQRLWLSLLLCLRYGDFS